MSLSSIKAGYDSSIFVVKPSQKFECPICLNVLKDPRQCVNGHLFCHACITDALKKHQVCPLCKINISVESLGVSLFAQNTIEELDTFCLSLENYVDSSEYKCNWVGPLHNRVNHYEMNCLCFPLQCPNTGCDIVVYRKTLAHHVEQDCEFTLKLCPHCPVHNDQAANKLYLKSSLADHIISCEFRPANCVVCSETLPMCDMHTHLQFHCKLRKVSCPLFAINACSSQCPHHASRVEIEAHVLTLETVERVVEQISTLRSENQDLSTEINKINKDNQKLSAVVDNLNATNVQLHSENKELLTSRDELRAEHSLLTVRVEQLENSNASNAAQLESMNSQIETLTKLISASSCDSAVQSLGNRDLSVVAACVAETTTSDCQNNISTPSSSSLLDNSNNITANSDALAKAIALWSSLGDILGPCDAATDTSAISTLSTDNPAERRSNVACVDSTTTFNATGFDFKSSAFFKYQQQNEQQYFKKPGMSVNTGGRLSHDASRDSSSSAHVRNWELGNSDNINFGSDAQILNREQNNTAEVCSSTSSSKNSSFINISTTTAVTTSITDGIADDLGDDAADQQLTATQKKNRAKKLARIKQQQQQVQTDNSDRRSSNSNSVNSSSGGITQQQQQSQQQPKNEPDCVVPTDSSSDKDSSSLMSNSTSVNFDAIYSALEVVHHAVETDRIDFRKPNELTQLVITFINSVLPDRSTFNSTFLLNAYLHKLFRELLVSKPYGLAYVTWQNLEKYHKHHNDRYLKIGDCFSHIANIFNDCPCHEAYQNVLKKLVVSESNIYVVALCDHTSKKIKTFREVTQVTQVVVEVVKQIGWKKCALLNSLKI